jgi:cyanophycinase
MNRRLPYRPPGLGFIGDEQETGFVSEDDVGGPMYSGVGWTKTLEPSTVFIMPRCRFLVLLATILSCVVSAIATETSYRYMRVGQMKDGKTIPVAGIAMMGGGEDLDDAFRWLCAKANGGDFLILRARGDDSYNSYVNGLCKLNSVATLIVPDRAAAEEPRVADIIRRAGALFIAGGDQARYVNFWKGTPVQDAIDTDIAKDIPVGGTSAGLAVLGEFAYGALGDKEDDNDLASNEVLRDPSFSRVTLVRDFLRIPFLRNTITDSHFVKRDRMGRSLGFLARIIQEGWSQDPREIAVDEKSAVLVESNGTAMIIGQGNGAYFIRPTRVPEVCERGTPLTFRGISVFKAASGGWFDLISWTGIGGVNYSLAIEQGVIHSSQPNQAIY